MIPWSIASFDSDSLLARAHIMGGGVSKADDKVRRASEFAHDADLERRPGERRSRGSRPMQHKRSRGSRPKLFAKTRRSRGSRPMQEVASLNAEITRLYIAQAVSMHDEHEHASHILMLALCFEAEYRSSCATCCRSGGAPPIRRQGASLSPRCIRGGRDQASPGAACLRLAHMRTQQIHFIRPSLSAGLPHSERRT